MHITTTLDGDVTVVCLTGSLHEASAPSLDLAIWRLVDQGLCLCAVDCEHIETMNRAGVCAIVSLRQRLESIGGGLILFALPPHVEKVLDLARLSRLLSTARHRDDAVARLRSSRDGAANAGKSPSVVTRLAYLLLLSDTDPEPPVTPRVVGNHQESRSELTCLLLFLLDVVREPTRNG